MALYYPLKHESMNDEESHEHIRQSLFNHDSFDLAIKCGSSNWFPVHKLLVRRNRVLAGAIERLADTPNPPRVKPLADSDETVELLELPDDNPDVFWFLLMDLYGWEYDGSDAHFLPHLDVYLLAKKYGSETLQRSVLHVSNDCFEMLEEAQEDDDIEEYATEDFEAVKILFESTDDGDALRVEVLNKFAEMFDFLKARYPAQVENLLTSCPVFDEALGGTTNLLPF